MNNKPMVIIPLAEYQELISIRDKFILQENVVDLSLIYQPLFGTNEGINLEEISNKVYNCLRNERIDMRLDFIGDLVSKSEAEMLKIANFGRKSLNELREQLKKLGLKFNMKLPDVVKQELERRRQSLKREL